MAGIKRKSADESTTRQVSLKTKKPKTNPANKSQAKASTSPKNAAKNSGHLEVSDNDLVESDTSEDENGFYGFSANQEEDEDAAAGDLESSNPAPAPSKRIKLLTENGKPKISSQEKDSNGHMLGRMSLCIARDVLFANE